jgi:hypothetical protein
MALNFGNVASINTSAGGNYLRAWNIYDDVKFDGISEEVSGKRQDGGTWRAWDFTFSCPQGTYRERIFEPNEAGQERRKVKNANGHESEMPSDMERVLYFAAQLVDTYAHDKYDKYVAACAKISTFDQFIALLHKILDGSTKTSSLLLAGRNNNGTVYAALPNFVRVNSKTGEAYTSERFLGDNLGFSAWELQQKKEYDNAAPTAMKDTDSVPDVEKTNDDDFDDLMNDL